LLNENQLNANQTMAAHAAKINQIKRKVEEMLQEVPKLADFEDLKQRISALDSFFKEKVID
jgi:hypothetical protein